MQVIAPEAESVHKNGKKRADGGDDHQHGGYPNKYWKKNEI
jgi:hypothetical protein